MARAERIDTSGELGRAHRRFDTVLGALALLPLALPPVAVVSGWAPAAEMRTAGAIWASLLLAFFAGVRRGLTFSERSGGRRGEIATMLGLFALAAVSMLFRSLLLAALGLAAVGVLDAVAARRGEAPGYFRGFRPVQMGAATLAVLLLWVEVSRGA